MIFVEAKTSRLLVACTLGIGLILLLLWPLKVWGQEGAGRPVNLDVILLIDNSWSMSRGDPATGAPPSDPEQMRIRAARFLVDYLRANAETVRANYRVGVVSFGGEVGDVIPLRLLQDDAVREGIRAEEIRLTDFRGPLQRALQELEAKSFGTGNRMAVLLFTDGRPHLTATPMTEGELRAYFEDLASLAGDLQEAGASVFILGIRDVQEDRDNWIRIVPQERYFSVTSTEQLVDVSRHILADLTGAAIPEASVIPTGQAVFVDVEHYLERVLFSFMKSDPAIHITLISPSGAILAPTTGGTAEVHHAIYSIRDPDPGRWKAFWEGEGEVRYWVERQYPLIRVESARSSSPVGQPITITASLVRNNEPVVDPDLQLEAKITLPDGDVVTQALSPIGDGRHTGIYEDVKVEGTYTVTAVAFLDDQRLLAHPLSVTVDVFALPTVATLTPQPTATLSSTPTPTTSPTSSPAPPSPTATPTPPSGIVGLISRGGTGLWILGSAVLVVVAAAAAAVTWIVLHSRPEKRAEVRPPERAEVWLPERPEVGPADHARDDWAKALRLGDCESIALNVELVVGYEGLEMASELMIKTIKSLLNKGRELCEGPFPLEDRIQDHLTEIKDASPKEAWDKVAAILVDLDYGAIIAESEELEEEIRDCIAALRDGLGIGEDHDEIAWILDSYPDVLQSQSGRNEVVDDAVALDAEAYERAKSWVTSVMSEVLKRSSDREGWEEVVQHLARQKSKYAPALFDGIAEVFYKERRNDPRALYDLLTVADAWISRVKKERVKGEENAKQYFSPLRKILFRVSDCAAEANDAMMDDLADALFIVFRDITYQKESIWTALVKLRRALRYHGAARFNYRDQVMALCRLCLSVVDPYTLKGNRGIIKLRDRDRAFMREYPGGEKLVEALLQLEGTNTHNPQELSRALQEAGEKIDNLQSTEEGEREGETLSFHKELLQAVVEVCRKQNI